MSNETVLSPQSERRSEERTWALSCCVMSVSESSLTEATHGHELLHCLRDSLSQSCQVIGDNVRVSDMRRVVPGFVTRPLRDAVSRTGQGSRAPQHTEILMLARRASVRAGIAVASCKPVKLSAIASLSLIPGLPFLMNGIVCRH